MTAPKRRPGTVRSFTPGELDFLILELGPDQGDSLRFKQLMEGLGLGRDLTPRCPSLAKTRRGDLTFLSRLTLADFVTKAFTTWLASFARARPVILYVSGHHVEQRPIFYNDQTAAILFKQDLLRAGSFVSGLFWDIKIGKEPRQEIEVDASALGNRLGVIIGDACTLLATGTIIEGTGVRLQGLFPSKPVVLGFIGKSPPAGTAPLHAAFLRCVQAKGSAGALTDQDLISCWIKAGRVWSGGRYTRNIGALDSGGTSVDYRGRPTKPSVP